MKINILQIILLIIIIILMFGDLKKLKQNISKYINNNRKKGT